MRRASLLPLVLLLSLPAGRAVEPGADPPSSRPDRIAPVWAPGVPVVTAAGVSDPVPVEAAFVADQLLVAPPPGVSLSALARAVGGEILAEVGRSGYGALRVTDVAGAREALQGRGAELAPMGRVVGAGRGKASSSSSSAAAVRSDPDRWHLRAMGFPTASPGDLSGYVVAVLDSGVAYQADAGHVQATGLASVTFVAPEDFVELDGAPHDDHQHGTHIASLIASTGWIPGAAPGVSLMPVKVLDRNNQGTEWALVEGLHHAVDHGADVINLSLSFPLGYVPSLPLQDALTRAADAGIVVVAAAGNDGDTEISWPAASRLVVAVGASTAQSVNNLRQAPYTNVGPRVDVLAPGGNVAADLTGDGWPDGILAETIEPGDPTRLGYWFYQGTSQATALASGAAVRLLAAGVHPDDVAATLQAQGYSASNTLSQGFGVTHLDVADALACESTPLDVLANVLPYLVPAGNGGLRQPTARIAAVDGAGAPLARANVVVTVDSEAGTSWWSCVTDSAGQCTIALGPTRNEDVWAFRVDTIEVAGVAHRPAKALFASDGAEVVIDAVQASGLSYDALAVYWPAGRDPVLGPLAAAFAVVDAGVGAATGPMALLVAENAVHRSAIETVSVEVDGTGLLSSPLGFTTVKVVSFGGSGLLSSPLGYRTVRLAGIDGSGLLSSPLGFHATQLYTGSRTLLTTGTLSGTGLLSSPLGFAGTTIRLDSGLVLGRSLDGTALQAMVDGEDGLRTADGYEPATLLVGSGAVSVGLHEAGSAAAPVVPPVRWTR